MWSVFAVFEVICFSIGEGLEILSDGDEEALDVVVGVLLFELVADDVVAGGVE